MSSISRPVERRRFTRIPDDIRTATEPQLLARAIVDQLFYVRSTLPEQATRNDWYLALAYAVRDRLLDKWIRTARTLMTAGRPRRRLLLRRVPPRSAPRPTTS